MVGRLSSAAIEAIKARNPVCRIAAGYVSLREVGRNKHVGPCPICGGGRRSSRFETHADSERWVCAVCQDGGDVLDLVQAVERCSFREAVERLGGSYEPDPIAAERLERVMRDKRARAQRIAERQRARDREAAHEIWISSAPAHPLLDTYFEARGLGGLKIPPSLRLAPSLAYHGRIGGQFVRLHTGPAIVGAIQGADRSLIGLHRTWLAPDGLGKLTLADPETEEVLPAKKILGQHAGGSIRLAGPAEVLIIGEGYETTLSVAAELPRDPEGHPTWRGRRASFWSAVSLGNLAGRGDPAGAKPLHPVTGRPLPTVLPDLSSTSLQRPEWAEIVVLLGDGDSDRPSTEAMIERAARRFQAAGAQVHIAWATPGQDFNDMRREASRGRG